MKRVLAGLAGAIALAGMSSMGIAQAPEKTERPAAKREAQLPQATPAPRATRQADKPAAHAPVKRPAAAQRSRPQPLAARWLSTVRWLIPRSAEMFLLGSQARTRSKIWC